MTDTRAATLVIDHRHGRTIRGRLITAALLQAGTRCLVKLSSMTFSPELMARLADLERTAVKVPLPKGTWVEKVTVESDGTDLAAEWVHGAHTSDAREQAILYLHGGGWLMGGLNSHRAMSSRISSASRTPVFALDYRMVPAVTFDQEIEDCVTGYRWLLERGIPADRIVIMGDSAGGHLTLATAVRVRARGLPQPAALVGISGVYDLVTASKSARARAEHDATGSLVSLRWLTALEWMLDPVLAGLDPAHPDVSPLRADLAGLAPTLLTVSSSELVYCDSEDTANALVAAGVPCTLQIWDGQLHVFQLWAPLFPETRRAIGEIGGFVRAAMG